MVCEPTITDGTPTVRRHVTTILDHAPVHPGAAVPWLATLDDDQIDRVWVALVIDLHERDPLSVQALADILTYVRDRLRGNATRTASNLSGVESDSYVKLSREERGKRVLAGIERARAARQAGDPAAILTGDDDGG